MQKLLRLWNQFTVREQIAAVLVFAVLVVEIGTVIFEFNAIQRRVAERAHSSALEFTNSVIPFVLSHNVEERASVASALTTKERSILLGETPPINATPLSATELEAFRKLADNDRLKIDTITVSESVYRDAEGNRNREIYVSLVPAGEVQQLLVRTRVLEAEVRQPLLLVLIFDTCVSFVALALVLVVLARMLRPLENLKRNADLISHGETVEEIPAFQGGRDIRGLIRVFNRMSKIILQTMAYQRGLLMSLGHDLKTPLNHAREIASDAADEQVKERLLHSLDKAHSVLSVVTDYTRATLRDGALEKVEVSSLLDSILEEAQERGSNASGVFPTTAYVQAHYNGLSNALRNLIENAVKYGETASVQLIIGQHSVSILIDDDGPGLDEAMLEEVFVPFRRLSDDSSGTGLGLPIAKTLITNDGGELQLSNRREGGLRATVVFPIYQSPVVPRST